ncbi:MAG: hypothetical protein COA58_05210 [Bacteroidetes bacterium]|nr:MAG: hypothetical protein COA58_05210 [Bacteroidota bacterium]
MRQFKILVILLFSISSMAQVPAYRIGTFSSQTNYITKMKTISLKPDSVKPKTETDNFLWLATSTNNAQNFHDMIYKDGGKLTPLSNNSLFIGDKTGSLYTEIVNDYMGPLRLSLGSMITNSTGNDSNETKNETIRNLVNNSGNVALTVDLPLFYLRSKKSQLNLIATLKTKGTADFKEFGTTSEDWAGKFSTGLNVYAMAHTDNDKIGLFFNFDLNQNWGTEIYYQNLEIDESFWYAQMSAGLVVQNLKFSFALPSISSVKSIENTKIVFSTQIIPIKK